MDSSESSSQLLKHLEPNVEIACNAMHGSTQFFYFDIDAQPSLIVFEAWPLDEVSDPDIYVQVVPKDKVDPNDVAYTAEQLEQLVNYQKCKWKANTHGKKRLEITPFDPWYRQDARYYVAAQPFRKNQNQFAVKMQQIEAKPIQEIENKKLYQGLSLKDGSTFLSYDIQNVKKSYLLFEVSKKSNVQIFISSRFQYPDGNINYRWAFGDLNISFIQELKKNPNMRDMFTQVSPYKIVYEDESNPAFGTATLRYMGEFANLQDFAVTFYSKESKHIFNNLFALDKYSADYQDGLKFIIDTSYWEYFGKKAYIGIYYTEGEKDPDEPEGIELNKEFSENRVFDFKMTEIPVDDLMTGPTKIRYDIFTQVYTEYNPSNDSQIERSQLDPVMQDRTEFTYGEVIYEHYLPMLKVVEPKAGEVFWDVGCGGAKPVAIAALNFPELKACKGIEYLPGLCETGRKSMELMQTLVDSLDEEDRFKLPEVSIEQGDLLERDWPEEADILYSSSVCFPEELTNGIAKMCQRLKSGARIISLNDFTIDVSEYLEEIRLVKMKMTWGTQVAYLYRRK